MPLKVTRAASWMYNIATHFWRARIDIPPRHGILLSPQKFAEILLLANFAGVLMT